MNILSYNVWMYFTWFVCMYICGWVHVCVFVYAFTHTSISYTVANNQTVVIVNDIHRHYSLLYVVSAWVKLNNCCVGPDSVLHFLFVCVWCKLCFWCFPFLFVCDVKNFIYCSVCVPVVFFSSYFLDTSNVLFHVVWDSLWVDLFLISLMSFHMFLALLLQCQIK